MARKRRKTSTNSKHKTQLGTKQLPQVQSARESPEVSGLVDEPRGSERLDGGRGRGGAPDLQTEEPMAGDVRILPADPASGPSSAAWGGWNYRVVRGLEDIKALGEWLQHLGGVDEKTPVGCSVGSLGNIAFATKQEGWYIPHTIAEHPVLRQVLLSTIGTERRAPALVVHRSSDFLDWFPRPSQTHLEAVANNVVHDMIALEYATGRAVPRGLPALQEALDCAVVGPALALEAPAFYTRVGFPITKFRTRTPPDEAIRWTLTYDYLLFRVVTALTRDPTMTRWFDELKNPMVEFGRVVDLPPREAVSFLLWMICGGDETLLTQHHLDWAPLLPDTPKLIQATRIDKQLPNLRLGLVRMLEQVSTVRRTTTMYGRRSPWGLRPEELLHFSVFGSINDILDVANASLIHFGSSYHSLCSDQETKHPSWLRARFVGYTTQEPLQWQSDVEKLALLNHPLVVSLDPKVVVE